MKYMIACGGKMLCMMLDDVCLLSSAIGLRPTDILKRGNRPSVSSTKSRFTQQNSIQGARKISSFESTVQNILQKEISEAG